MADIVSRRTLHIYEHSARGDVPDDPADSFSTAYGRGIFPKINECIKDAANAAVKEKALSALCDLWKNPLNAVQSIPFGIHQQVSRVLLNTSIARPCRVLASLALCLFVKTRCCRELFHSDKALVTLLLDSIADREEAIRMNSIETVKELCKSVAGTAAVIEERLISRLIHRIQDENNSAILTEVLYRLSHVVADKMGAATLIELDPTLQSLTSLLRSQDNCVRASCAQCLAQISRDCEGKKFVLQANAVFKLNKLLEDENEEVVMMSCRALMHLASDIRGKSDIVELGVIPSLLSLLKLHESTSPRSEFICMFALQCLASVAENPRGRVRLNQPEVLSLLAAIDSSRPKLHPYIQRARTTIEWQP